MKVALEVVGFLLILGILALVVRVIFPSQFNGSLIDELNAPLPVYREYESDRCYYIEVIQGGMIQALVHKGNCPNKQHRSK
jgi:hypothetical protein